MCTNGAIPHGLIDRKIRQWGIYYLLIMQLPKNRLRPVMETKKLCGTDLWQASLEWFQINGGQKLYSFPELIYHCHAVL